jgi:hypothetical protein
MSIRTCGATKCALAKVLGMGRTMKPLGSVLKAVVCALTLWSASAPTIAQTAASPELPKPRIARGNRAEPGLQGQTTLEDIVSGRSQEPYYAGTRIVGHTDIWNRGANLQLAKIDNCAYVSTFKANGSQGENSKSAIFLRPPAGVAVIDVTNPHSPTPVRVLRDKGSIDAVETMYAVAAADRKVLVAGAYAGGLPGYSAENAAWISIYDASDCKNPKLMSEFAWPENVHMITLSPNGRRVYGTAILPKPSPDGQRKWGKGGILVLDITDMAHPRFIGKFGATRPDGTSYEFATHEVSLSADERRIYAAVLASEGGDFSGDPEGPLDPQKGGVYILDNTDIVEGHADVHLRLIGVARHGGWHSVVPAKINGVPYLVGAGELGVCPGSWPKIINIADERNPRIDAEFKLQMNQPENCSTTVLGTRETALTGSVASHFNDVDDAQNTRLGLFPFLAGGLRIVDLRNPSKPVEVAYYKPGAHPGTILNARGLHWTRTFFNDQATDACMSHALYVPQTGHIWFASVSNGFYVLELTPEVRASLGLPRVPSSASVK